MKRVRSAGACSAKARRERQAKAPALGMLAKVAGLLTLHNAIVSL